MRKFAVALLATTSIALLSQASLSQASAADLPRRMPVKAPAPVYTPPFSWTGFYLGGNVGGGWSSGNGSATLGGVPGTFSGSGDGFLGGIQAGYNWQVSNFVLGLETDFQGSSGSGNVNGVAGATTFTGTGKNPWFGTVRGRLGYAADRWLFYVTGGGLYGKSTLDGVVSTTGPFSSSTTYWTWTVGAGVETMLWDRWSGKIEYLYAGKPDNIPTPPGTAGVSGSANTNIVRVGLNYHF